MTIEQFESFGWEHILDGFGFWLFKKDRFRIQYLYDRKAMYVTEMNESGDFDTIYKGKCPDVYTFKVIMELLMMK